MITGMNLTSTEMLLGQMDASPFDFVLTGSRHFGGVTDSSDWDFFVQDSVEVRRFLMEKGFELDPLSYQYQDSVTISVFKHRKVPVHIQVVNDFRKKMRAQKVINDMKILTRITGDKQSARLIWSQVLKLV